MNSSTLQEEDKRTGDCVVLTSPRQCNPTFSSRVESISLFYHFISTPPPLSLKPLVFSAVPLTFVYKSGVLLSRRFPTRGRQVDSWCFFEISNECLTLTAMPGLLTCFNFSAADLRRPALDSVHMHNSTCLVSECALSKPFDASPLLFVCATCPLGISLLSPPSQMASTFPQIYSNVQDAPHVQDWPHNIFWSISPTPSCYGHCWGVSNPKLRHGRQLCLAFFLASLGMDWDLSFA